MAKYKFNLSSKENANNFNNINSYLGIMNRNDDLTISLGQNSDSEMRYICETLQQKEYQISINRKKEKNEINIRKFE